MNRKELENTIHDHFNTIITRAGYVDNGRYNLDTQKRVVAESLGRLLFDYMVASVYDMSWEGYTDQELEGISSLFQDMETAQKNT